MDDLHIRAARASRRVCDLRDGATRGLGQCTTVTPLSAEDGYAVVVDDRLVGFFRVGEQTRVRAVAQSWNAPSRHVRRGVCIQEMATKVNRALGGGWTPRVPPERR